MSEERRLVTVLFADVVGSTSMGESLDPEDLRPLLSRFYEIARQVVDGHSGTLEKFIGDAAMAIFGLPQAHDDDARRAIAAALELCERVREDPALGDRLPIRVGINSGEVVASRDRANQDFIVTGDAVNVAARLQQSADPWQVLVSARTASASGGAYAFGPPVDLELKGKGAPVTVRPVIGPSSEEAPKAPLVGRDADLQQLELVARRAFGERRPYLVSLIAPAGTGKSRLVEEFIDRLDDLAADAQVAVAQCLPYGQRLTYWPMRSLLLHLLDEADASTTPEGLREQINDWLQRHGAERPRETADILAATIGASDTEVLDRAALFAAWRETLELAAATRPLVLLIEDLHWSSGSLLDLIEFILQPRADAPMLMLALTRPELLERRPTWGGGRRNHISLALEPLDSGSVERLVENILDGPAPELVPIVVQRSEGNPFYAGEIVRSLVERGVNLRDPDAVRAAAAGLPDTVQATVLARLDGLDTTARRVVQLGSVFGRTFSVQGLAAVTKEPEAELEAAVERLIDRELVRPSGRSELTFRHILIRDVAYGTMPRAERAIHHAAAGAWLERKAAGREDELAELIAFHYRESVTLRGVSGTEDSETRTRAVRWLRRAAEVAAGARGISEAVAHLRAALELAPSGDHPEIYQRIGEFLGSGDRSMQAFAEAWRVGTDEGRDPSFLLTNLSRQLMVMTRWFSSVAHQPPEEEVSGLIARGQEWVKAADERARATFLIAQGFMPFWIRNSDARPLTDEDVRNAIRAAAEGLAIAERIDDPILISAALDAMTSHAQHADPVAARGLSRRRLSMGSRLSNDERLDALNMVSWTSAMLGDLDDMLESSQTAMALIQPGQNPGFSVGAASWHAYANALVGDWDALVSSVTELRTQWLEADRPAASYAVQGLLSGVDWARNRGDETLLDRWRDPAIEIITQFESPHPFSALRAIVELDADGIGSLLEHHARYPDRVHYIEHAMAVAADHRFPVLVGAIEEIREAATAAKMRAIAAQAARLLGLLRNDHGELARSLALFEQIGAARYACRVRIELGRAAGDEALLAIGRRELDDLGELALEELS